MEDNSAEIVYLDVEGSSICCRRSDLAQNSDYFKAMFEGNFVESRKSIIELKEVTLESMQIILTLLRDKKYPLEETILLPVLQTACMLQFLEVEQICIEQIKQKLSFHNCLKTWTITEQLCLKDIFCKAKLLALLQFSLVKKTLHFMELSLNELVNYLKNANLQCLNELEVFEAAMDWYENYDEKNFAVLFKLMKCINFNKISDTDMKEIITHHYIQDHSEMVQILKSVISKNEAAKNQEEVKVLLNSKERNREGFPCIFVDKVEKLDVSLKAVTLFDGPSELSDYFVTTFLDQFKRRRMCQLLKPMEKSESFAMYLDPTTHSLNKLFTVEGSKFANFEGAKIIGYKNLVFAFGGKLDLSREMNWNFDFWVYDVIREIWKSFRLPKTCNDTPVTAFPGRGYHRRHFEACVCGKYLFVVGGTGACRVVENNMYWCDLEESFNRNVWNPSWSKVIDFPGSFAIRQFKCCQLYNKLFLLDINNKMGYTFCPWTKWTTLQFEDPENLLPRYSKEMAVFSYKDQLHIKASKLYKFELNDKKFHIKEIYEIESTDNNASQSQAVLSNGVLYSVYNRRQLDEESKYSIEAFDVDSRKNEIYYEAYNGHSFSVGDTSFILKRAFNIVNVFYPLSVEKDDFINQE